MASVEESSRLIVQAEQKGFEQTQLAIERTEGQLEALTRGYQAGSFSLDHYMERGQQLQSRLDALKAAFAKADDAVKRYGSTQAALAALTKESGSRMDGFGQSLLQTGRIVQDFQAAGLGGIANNIEGFTQEVGGLAGAATLAGVAFEVFKPHIYAFIESLNTGAVKAFSGQVETLTERIKELEDMPHKLTVDIRELETARRQVEDIRAALSAVDRLRKSRNSFVQEEKYKEGLAPRVFRQSQDSTGVQFPPDQAREVATKSVELHRQGMNANQATLLAMQQGLLAMAKLATELQRQQDEARQLGQGFRRVAAQAVEHQPSAQNFGGPN